jgi:glycerol-3-phosphate dehydrogenase
VLNCPPRVPLASDFDIVIIGGGITGVAIARECALAGRRVLIVDKNDFGSGTTSRTTRIVHGGLRYVEHGEFGMVREALVERERLLRERPHLVRPRKFVFALSDNSRHSALELRLGLWLYRRLAGERSASRAPRADLATMERDLDANRRWTLFEYDDAQCEFPERLVAEWLVEALSAGATARNYTEVLEVPARDGRVRGVRLRDRLDENEQFVRAEWVINAAGPWADQVFATAGLDTTAPMLSPTRGTHIVLPCFAGSPTSPLYTEAIDGRAVFLIPWNGALLVGATEVPESESPDKVKPTPVEVRYLLSLVNRLYPEAALTAADILYTFAGVRPLTYSTNPKLNAVSRRHVIRNHAADGALGLYSVLGGKLTTAAALARHCARTIGLRKPAEESVAMASADVNQVDSVFGQWARMVSSAAGISEPCARSLAGWHGTRALTIATLAKQDERQRVPLFEGSCHIVAEALEAVHYECAVTLGDILLRRVPVALDPRFNDDHAATAAQRIGAALGWTEAQIQFSLESFREEREAFLRKPATALASAPAEHAA